MGDIYRTINHLRHTITWYSITDSLNQYKNHNHTMVRVMIGLDSITSRSKWKFSFYPPFYWQRPPLLMDSLLRKWSRLNSSINDTRFWRMANGTDLYPKWRHFVTNLAPLSFSQIQEKRSIFWTNTSIDSLVFGSVSTLPRSRFRPILSMAHPSNGTIGCPALDNTIRATVSPSMSWVKQISERWSTHLVNGTRCPCPWFVRLHLMR